MNWRVFTSLAATAVLLTGCMSVPQNQFVINPKDGAVTIKTPKDIEIKNARVIKRHTGDVEVTFDSYSSKNSPAVIDAVSNANAEMSANMVKMGKLLLELSGGAASEVATGGLAP